jgi:hypothetical protein
LPWLVYGFLCNLIAIYIYGFPKKVQNSNPNETQTIDETKTIKNQIMENKNNNDNTQKEDNFCKKLAIWLNRKKLGFKNVHIYFGGMYEWLLLQEVFGVINFQTDGFIKNIVDYKIE